MEDQPKDKENKYVGENKYFWKETYQKKKGKHSLFQTRSS